MEYMAKVDCAGLEGLLKVIRKDAMKAARFVDAGDGDLHKKRTPIMEAAADWPLTQGEVRGAFCSFTAAQPIVAPRSASKNG